MGQTARFCSSMLKLPQGGVYVNVFYEIIFFRFVIRTIRSAALNYLEKRTVIYNLQLFII